MISSWGFSVIINLPPEVTMSIIGLYSRAYSPPTSTVQGLLTCYCWGDLRGAPATSSATPALNSCASLTIPLSFTLQCQQLMPLLKLEKHINMESPKFIVAVLFTISEFVSIYNPQFYEDHSNWSLFSTAPRLSVEEGDGVIQRLFQRVEGLFDLQAPTLRSSRDPRCGPSQLCLLVYKPTLWLWLT